MQINLVSTDAAREAMRILRYFLKDAHDGLSGVDAAKATVSAATSILQGYAPKMSDTALAAIVDAANRGKRIAIDGRMVFGNTYPLKLQFKITGATWHDDAKRRWLFPNDASALAFYRNHVDANYAPADNPVPNPVPALDPIPSPIPSPVEVPAMQNPIPSPIPGDDAASQLSSAIAGILATLKPGLDPSALAPIMARLEALEAREGMGPVKVEVERPGAERPHYEGICHRTFPKLVKLADCFRRAGSAAPIALIGPAGTGKTHSAEALAEALAIPFHAISVGPATTQYQIMGYMDANGNYVRTAARDAFEHGGILLIDEADAASPAAILVLNAMTANSSVGFPDGIVKRHANFRCILAMNTWGRGATDGYKRQAMDRALENRLAKLSWPIDEALELQLCGNNMAVMSYILKLRAEVKSAGADMLIGPRQTMMISQMLADGFTASEAREIALGYDGLNDDVRKVVDRVSLAGME